MPQCQSDVKVSIDIAKFAVWVVELEWHLLRMYFEYYLHPKLIYLPFLE